MAGINAAKIKVNTTPLFLARVQHGPVMGAEGKEEPPKGELYIYDEIGPGWWGLIDARLVKDAIDKMDDAEVIDLHLNSPGGDVFEGVAIYNLLKNAKQKVNVYIDGLAASIASIIALAGDQIEIAENGMVMIHKAWTWASGNADDLAKTVDTLNKVDATLLGTYMSRSTASEEELLQMMADETWMSASEALELGFVDSVNPNKQSDKKTKNAGDLNFRNAPREVIERLTEGDLEIPVKDTDSYDLIALQRAKHRQRKRLRQD